MKSILLAAGLCAATLMTGCRTVAVVSHGHRAYSPSHAHTRIYYSSGRPYYYHSGRRYWGYPAGYVAPHRVTTRRVYAPAPTYYRPSHRRTSVRVDL